MGSAYDSHTHKQNMRERAGAAHGSLSKQQVPQHHHHISVADAHRVRTAWKGRGRRRRPHWQSTYPRYTRCAAARRRGCPWATKGGATSWRPQQHWCPRPIGECTHTGTGLGGQVTACATGEQVQATHKELETWCVNQGEPRGAAPSAHTESKKEGLSTPLKRMDGQTGWGHCLGTQRPLLTTKSAVTHLASVTAANNQAPKRSPWASNSSATRP